MKNIRFDVLSRSLTGHAAHSMGKGGKNYSRNDSGTSKILNPLSLLNGVSYRLFFSSCAFFLTEEFMLTSKVLNVILRRKKKEEIPCFPSVDIRCTTPGHKFVAERVF